MRRFGGYNPSRSGKTFPYVVDEPNDTNEAHVLRLLRNAYRCSLKDFSNNIRTRYGGRVQNITLAERLATDMISQNITIPASDLLRNERTMIFMWARIHDGVHHLVGFFDTSDLGRVVLEDLAPGSVHPDTRRVVTCQMLIISLKKVWESDFESFVTGASSPSGVVYLPTIDRASAIPLNLDGEQEVDMRCIKKLALARVHLYGRKMAGPDHVDYVHEASMTPLEDACAQHLICISVCGDQSLSEKYVEWESFLCAIIFCIGPPAQIITSFVETGEFNAGEMWMRLLSSNMLAHEYGGKRARTALDTVASCKEHAKEKGLEEIDFIHEDLLLLQLNVVSILKKKIAKPEFVSDRIVS